MPEMLDLLTDPPDDPAGRALRAGLILAQGVATDTSTEARSEALDVLQDGDGLAFAVFLAAATGNMFAAQIDDDDGGPITLDVLGPDGEPKSIDDVDEPNRTAWRAILASANGDDPAPFLLTVDSTDASAALTALLIRLYELGTAGLLADQDPTR